MKNLEPRTDTQRLAAIMYANGLTLEDFASLAGLTPRTMEKRLADSGADWKAGEIANFNAAMKGLDPTFGAKAVDAIFFTHEPRHTFKKPYFLAVCEIGLGISEQEAADMAGITLEALRGLYNACDTQDKLAEAARVWNALGQKGKWESFYLCFLDYPENPKA